MSALKSCFFVIFQRYLYGGIQIALFVTCPRSSDAGLLKKRRIADSAQFFDLFCTLRKGSELNKFAKKRRIVDSAQILYSVLQ